MNILTVFKKTYRDETKRYELYEKKIDDFKLHNNNEPNVENLIKDNFVSNFSIKI